MEYSRPQAWRRENLFGGVVKLDRVWTPGANEATAFEFDRDVVLNGLPVVAGRYSVWMVPNDEGDWSVHLHEDFDRFHTQKPDLDEMTVSADVAPASGEYIRGAHLGLSRSAPRRRGAPHATRIYGRSSGRCGEPSTRGAVTSEEIAPYLGQFSMTWYGDEEQTWVFPVELIDADGKLRGIVDDGDWSFQLLPTNEPDEFFFAPLQDGEMADMEDDPLSFEIEGAWAVGFRGRDKDDRVWISGERNCGELPPPQPDGRPRWAGLGLGSDSDACYGPRVASLASDLGFASAAGTHWTR